MIVPRPLIIVGAGDHARVLLDSLRRTKADIQGFVTKDGKKGTLGPLGYPILGDDDALEKYRSAGYELVNGLGSIDTRSLGNRADLYERLTAKGWTFASVIDPTAIISTVAVLGRGVQVMAGAIIQSGADLRENVLVNSGAIVEHDCRLARHAVISPGAVLSGAVQVGERTHVGTRACAVQYKKIGRDCLIAAGAVIAADVPDGQKVIGAWTKSRAADATQGVGEDHGQPDVTS
jgi:sugar O-acyltransferase (sialic acid O-acetyltransferase NeuD family)